MTFLTLLLQATPHVSTTPAAESYDTFGVPWYWFVIAVVLVGLAFFWAYKKGMLSWLPGFKTKPKHTYTAEPPK